jgi:hypothetical protein
MHYWTYSERYDAIEKRRVSGCVVTVKTPGLSSFAPFFPSWHPFCLLSYLILPFVQSLLAKVPNAPSVAESIMTLYL